MHGPAEKREDAYINGWGATFDTTLFFSTPSAGTLSREILISARNFRLDIMVGLTPFDQDTDTLRM